ncbi:RNA chaperone ProQ [Aliidiomarina minuta]|uniref:RNA chaperone ProQ n=1 Tax=Aliidiomarina minuta TaxID=880057 RepID=A0A432W6L6_9GAMM|nr:RNA chaperone ProQ [Aliidiomarina minuta]RUO25718.1 RNA chaperone ProQ [Aliidiomarina minuta]
MDNQETSEKLATSKAVIAYLAEQFPQCFTLSGEAKPLKIGIFEDLAKRMEGDPKVSKTRLRSALRQYTSSWRYLRGVKTGTDRVDLDGAKAGIVEDEHAQHAQETLAESKAKVAEKRKAEKPAADKTQPSDKKKPRPKPSAGKAANKSKHKKAEPELKAVTLGDLEEGQNVQVKVGQSPMPGTVIAIEKSEVQVQLVSGITVKVKIENVFVTS